jgi:hypothetical protein
MESRFLDKEHFNGPDPIPELLEPHLDSVSERLSLYASCMIPYLTVYTAEEGCAQWHLLCGYDVHEPEIWKELPPEATHDPRKERRVSHLTFYLLQPNPTLLETITSDLTEVRGLRNPMTTTHRDQQG